MLATLLHPDAGTARVLGHDIVTEAEAVRAAVSLTGQMASVDEDLTGRENLILLGRLLGMKPPAAKERAAELLDAFGLAESASKLVKNYSGGMRRRLDIAASIVVTPELMFLDEPTTGLDPRSRNQVWDIVRALVAEGTTILLCTQYLEEADQLADRIAVLDHGRIVAEGTPDELKRQIPGGHLVLRFADPGALRTAAAVLNVTNRDESALTLQVPSDGDIASLRAVLATLDGVHVAPDHLTIHTPDLDDVFFAFTGNPASTDEETR
jgi:ABC-2 type transport system ATP-binding protein